MSIEQQKQIKDNSTELQEFLKDLTDWEHTVKEKEKKLIGSAAKKVPPVQGQRQTSVDKEGDETTDRTAEQGPGTASAHTYDYFRDKWDKFDVDAALAKVDEEPQIPSPKKVARTSKIQTTSTKGKVDDKLLNSNVNASSSYSFGGGKGNSVPAATRKSLSSSYNFEGPVPDARSEKDLGNEYFKEGKFVQAIECYSRSIALEPTAVAFANRAMASLKIRRYADAEVDCTEAITLDDRYTKAYSRRGTARKELQNYLAAVEDFEFALRLEPENKELKKQYVDAKDIYEKFAVKAKPMQKKVPVLVQEMPDSHDRARDSTSPLSPKPTSSISSLRVETNGTNKIGIGESHPEKLDETLPHKSDSPVAPPAKAVHPDPKISEPPPVVTEAVHSDGSESGNNSKYNQISGASKGVPSPSAQKAVSVVEKIMLQTEDYSQSSLSKITSSKESSTYKGSKEQAKKVNGNLTSKVVAPTQASVDRAVMNARAGLVRNMVAPKTSYEFETTWKGFSGDRSSQARLLKIMEASSLPKVFKDSLGAPLLLEIIRSLPLLLPEDAKMVLDILQNLTKVGRFSMTVMFLTSKDRTDMRNLWEGLLATKQLSSDEQKKLMGLCPIYRLS